MKQTHKNHLTNPLAQLESINTKTLCHSLTAKEVEKLRLELLKLLKNPILKQGIDLLKQQNAKAKITLQKISNIVFRELISTEKYINSLINKYDKDKFSAFFSDREKNIEDSIIGKYQEVNDLIVAYLQVRMLTKNNVPFADIWLLDISIFQKMADDIFLKTPNFIAWERENKAYNSRLNILNSILNLNASIDDGPELPSMHMVTNLQEICSYFIEILTITTGLSTLKIHSISFHYTASTKKKKASIKLFINDKSIKFSGNTATMLKVVLDNPFDEIDIDEFDFIKAEKKDATSISNNSLSQKLYRKFEKINSGIALSLELREFQILFFLEYKKNSMWLNPLYRNSLQPLTFK